MDLELERKIKEVIKRYEKGEKLLNILKEIKMFNREIVSCPHCLHDFYTIYRKREDETMCPECRRKFYKIRKNGRLVGYLKGVE